MAKMFSKGFKPKSTTKKAKQIIQSEIKDYFNPREYGTRSTISAVKKNADAYNCGNNSKNGNYQKFASLVDAGCFACYYSDQRKMLGKIYGKDNVEKWSGDKVHSTYKHLIGRECDSMWRKQTKNK